MGNSNISCVCLTFFNCALTQPLSSLQYLVLRNMNSDVAVTEIAAAENTNSAVDNQSITSAPSTSHSTEFEDGQGNVDKQIDNLNHRRHKRRKGSKTCCCQCRCRCCKMCRLWKVTKLTLFPLKKVLSEMSCYH